jgi:dolichol-phosphate mannosyltransferase
MARVSLVYPVGRNDVPSVAHLGRAVQRLETAGHEVEVVLTGPPGDPEPRLPGIDARFVTASAPGRNAAACAGLLAAGGEALLVLDGARAYRPDDIALAVERLVEGGSRLVIASRHSPSIRGLAPHRLLHGRLARILTGSTDPTSGLVGLTREALEAARPHLRGQGSQFALELLARTPGVERIELGIAPPHRPAGSRPSAPRPLLGDIKHLKRLADERFGTVSRLLQFCMVGASGMIVDLTSYAGWGWLLGRTPLARTSWPMVGPLDLALAGLLAVGLALLWNFTLNRRLTFNDARSGSIPAQFIAYCLSNALGVIVSLALRLSLPRHVAFFEAHKLAAAVVGIVVATGLSFTMARWLVFRKTHPPQGQSAAELAPVAANDVDAAGFADRPALASAHGGQ